MGSEKIFDVAKRFASAYVNILQQPNFSIKKMYNALRGDFKKVSWRKMICNNPAPLKCSFGTWLTIHARLPTCDKLNKIDIYCDQLCILCKNEDGTHSHIFFKCECS